MEIADFWYDKLKGLTDLFVGQVSEGSKIQLC